MYIEELNFCVLCIEQGVISTPPTPLTVRMMLYTSDGNDSMIISGTQTNMYVDVTTPFRKRTIVNTPGNKPGVFDIQGRKMDYRHEDRNLSQGMSIIINRLPGRIKAAKKVKLTE